jgi:arylsulfatase A-like enzyme
MNVAVVILESTAAQYLGLYGAGEDPMPALTKLAGRAVVFDAAYAVYPESVKGLYATVCGASPRVGEPLEASLADPCSPLPKAFSAAGYRTGLFHAGRFGYLGMDKLVEQSGFDVAEDAGAIGGVAKSSFGVDEASTVARAIGWINDDADARPFFALYMPAAGHHPYASALPGPFSTSTEFGRYRNAIHETDEALGDFLAALPRDTVVMVFGDHGEAFGQHGGNSGHTLAIWEENVHVPMLIAIPGVTDTPRRVASPVSVLEVEATLLDLIGAARVPGQRASSMLAGADHIAPFFADYSLNWMGVRDGCWKLIYAPEEDRARLFNLCEDPGETSDVSGRFQTVNDELIKRVEQLFAVRVRPRRVAS